MDVEAPGVSEVYEAASQVRAVFQPIVDLATGEVVGYEALARGPAGSLLERPDRLFAAARERDMTAWMDWACRAAAFNGALTSRFTTPATLFVNVEPEVIDTACPAPWQETMARAQKELQTMFEVTERDLASKPAELLRVVEEIRAQGSGVALDDVGADWRSLALMPLIRPDVVKLDMHLVQQPLTPHGALVAEAVRAYAARSGAQIVAEGIETEAHRQRALGLGATLGQGWFYGRPGPLSAPSARHPARRLIVTNRALDGSSPMDVIAEQTVTAVAPKADLVAISRAIEQRAMDTTEPCVILSAFQSSEWFTPATAQLYSRLASRSAFVGAFGYGMPSEPTPGVRGASLSVNEHLLGEWSVILVAPHYAAALIAQDLGDQGPEMQRRFRFAILDDRDLVLRAARSLMLKMTAIKEGVAA